MPSPFPGMDPYLEQPGTWPDFHGSYLVCLRAELNRILPTRYVARWDRYVWLDDPEADETRPLGQPDAHVADGTGELRSGKVATLAAPATTVLPQIERKGKPFLRIVDAHDRRVVTVIELLSPANKTTGKDGEAYLANREEYLGARINLVEIDLLRAGRRPPVERPLPAGDYYVLVCRGTDYPEAGVWPVSVREPLPTVPIPLDPEVASVMLPLQPCLARVYDEGRLGEDMDYERDPAFPLSRSDATWARELLQARQSG